MKKLRVGKHILLELEDGVTNLYVNGDLFRQCKLLLLNIHSYEASDNIESVDEAAISLGWTHFGQSSQNIRSKISPETEFWAHCSNIQSWVENHYDTRLLHHTIAFPLLKKLTEVGDLKAKLRFKEEVAKRLEESTPQVLLFLVQENYLEIFTSDELVSVIQAIEFKNSSDIDYLKYIPEIFKNLIRNFNLPHKSTEILFEHLVRSCYGNLYDELKQILLGMARDEAQSILNKVEKGILAPNLQRIKIYFYYLSKDEKINLLDKALEYKSFHVAFELFTENPGLVNLKRDQIPLYVKEALLSGNFPTVSLLLDEGHLTYLAEEEMFEIVECISTYKFSEVIEEKIKEWFSWFKKGYLRFRGCYIHKGDVDVLQEIERTLEIKLIWTPHSLAISNYMFEIDTERRVSGLYIGTQLRREIPNDIRKLIKNLDNLKVIHLPDGLTTV
jgi:hypothetical protein